ncbi:MAG: DUF4258 domain-containing protein [Chlamydiae bacterium]|nr:DUF4258 domain-containing protein [Chlamydiota bacterium]MBI3266774.1 DUF4258 domain-containing protein [Chlamydiota bacterium]
MLKNNPLDFIRRCVYEGKIKWTYHVNMRLKERMIARDMIIKSANSYEVIESYPEDKYLPSYLVYAYFEDRPVHILFAVDVKDDHIRVVTSYYPTHTEWEDNFKKRRRL